MTKDSEIALLDHTIAKLGSDSYMGPWLLRNRDRIVLNIRNDHPVDFALPCPRCDSRDPFKGQPHCT